MVEVAATRRFGLDGRSYELDLCTEHDAALEQALAPYLAAARRPERRPPRRTSSRA